MPAIRFKGVDYTTPTVYVQSDASATDLENTKVPTGQTIKSYLNSNKFPKVLESNEVTATVQSGAAYLNQISSIVSIPSGYKFAGATLVVTGSGSSSGFWQIIGYNGNLNDPSVMIKQTTGSAQTWKYKVYVLIVPS